MFYCLLTFSLKWYTTCYICCIVLLCNKGGIFIKCMLYKISQSSRRSLLVAVTVTVSHTTSFKFRQPSPSVSVTPLTLSVSVTPFSRNFFLLHASRALATWSAFSTGRAVLPSTIKQVKSLKQVRSFKYYMLFSYHLQIFVPGGCPTSRSCTLRPFQRPYPPGVPISGHCDSLRIWFPFNLHGAERRSTFSIADRNLRSLRVPSLLGAAAWSRRPGGWPTEVLCLSSGAVPHSGRVTDRVHTLFDFDLRVSSVSFAPLVLC